MVKLKAKSGSFIIQVSSSDCVLGYRNPTKVARNNQQKHTFTAGSVGTFLLIAAFHLSRVSVAQGTYMVYITTEFQN